MPKEEYQLNEYTENQKHDKMEKEKAAEDAAAQNDGLTKPHIWDESKWGDGSTWG